MLRPLGLLTQPYFVQMITAHFLFIKMQGQTVLFLFSCLGKFISITDLSFIMKKGHSTYIKY